MTTLNILVCEPLGEQGLALLKNQSNFKVEVHVGLSKNELIEKIPNFDCLLVRSQTEVDRAVIIAGQKLKLIGRAGVGIDNIDIKTAQEKNIAVINTPSGNSISTAEYTFALILALARKIAPAHQHLLSGQWQRAQFKGIELFGKTLGIVGLGNVGRLLAERARAFQMKVQAFDPMLSQSTFDELGVKNLSFEDLLKSSDIISLHCGLNQQTKYMMNIKNISLMKKGAMLINAARGELIEPTALISALDSGHLSQAAMDVYAIEPPLKNDPLVHHPKILATPHLAASTDEAQTRVSTLLAEQAIGFFSGAKNLTRVV